MKIVYPPYDNSDFIEGRSRFVAKASSNSHGRFSCLFPAHIFEAVGRVTAESHLLYIAQICSPIRQTMPATLDIR